MPEGAAAAVARDHPLGAHNGRHLGDQVDGELLVHLFRALGEADQAVVALVERLPKREEVLGRPHTAHPTARSGCRQDFPATISHGEMCHFVTMVLSWTKLDTNLIQIAVDTRMLLVKVAEVIACR